MARTVAKKLSVKLPKAKIPHLPKTATTYEDAQLFNFGGGLNTKYSNNEIGDNESPDLLNVNFDQNGAVVKRRGFIPLNSQHIDSNAIMSLIPFEKSDGSRYLVACSGTSVYSWDWNALAWTAIKTGLSGNGVKFTGSVYNDVLYLWNGVDTPMTWDGSTFGALSYPPGSCAYAVVSGNRMYAAGDPLARSRLYYSTADDPTDWNATSTEGGFIDIDTNDGDIITGLALLLDSVVIFKRKSIWVLKGADPAYYTLIAAHAGVGCVSHWTIQNVLNNLVFLSEDGVYAFNGTGVTLLSDKIGPSLIGTGGHTGLNWKDIGNAEATVYQWKYWLSVPTGLSSTNDALYLYHYLSPAWTVYDLKRASFAVMRPELSTDAPTLYGGDAGDGFVYEEATTDADNSAPIDAYFLTKNFDFSYPEHYKRFKRFFAYALSDASSGTLTVTATLDFSLSSTVLTLNLGGSGSKWGSFTWGQATWGGQSNPISQTKGINGQARYIQFRVENNASGEPFTFLGIAIQVLVKTRLQ